MKQRRIRKYIATVIAIIIIVVVWWGVDEINKEFNIYTIQSIYHLKSGFTEQIPDPLTGNGHTNLIYEVYLNDQVLPNTKIIFELVGDEGARFDNGLRIKNVQTDPLGQAIIKLEPIKDGSDSLRISVSFGTFDDFVVEDPREYNFATSP